MRHLDFIVAGTFLAILAGAALFAALLDKGTPAADINLSFSALAAESDDAVFESDRSTVRFAVAAVLSPSAMLEEYEALARYMEDRLGRPVEMVRGKGYAEINALVRSGDVSVALVCSGAFVLGRRDFGMEPLVVPVVDGSTSYHSYLITRAGSTFSSLKDLRGATFAFTDPLSNSGRLVPVYQLAQMGQTPEGFFDSVIFTYSHDKSVQAVADGLVDGASVDSLVYEAMEVRGSPAAEATRVIWRSPPYGINPVVVHPDLDPGLKRTLADIFLNMDRDPEGRAVLDLLGIDSFTTPQPGAYDTIEQMLDATAAW